MKTNQIILQGVSIEELNEHIKEAVRQQVEIFKPAQKDIDNNLQLLSRQEVAELLKISLPTLHDWTNKKILKSYRLGNRVYYKAFEVEQSLIRIEK